MTGIGTQIKNALGWFIAKLKGNVVNNLTSTSTDLPLSAAKGKDLQDQITSLNTKIDVAFYVSSSAVTTSNRSSCKHKRVLLDIEVNVSAGGDIVLGAIQDGYRPKRRIYIQVAQFDGTFNRTYATAVIDTNGVIQLKSSTQNTVYTWINCSYDID